MITEALELSVKGGRDCHSCVCVVGHPNGGMVVGVGMEVVDGMHAGHSQKGWSFLG